MVVILTLVYALICKLKNCKYSITYPLGNCFDTLYRHAGQYEGLARMQQFK